MDYMNGKGGGGPDIYTPPNGYSPQSMQTDLSAGQTLTAPQIQQVQQGVQGANAQIGQLNTQAGRQPYIDNTNLGAEQGNYDQLAQQLAHYDNLVLKPEFAGQNPNSPQDVPTGGITSAVPEFSSQAANYTPEQLLWNPNPKFGAEAQLNHADNILGLMTNLNELMGKERSRGTAKYTSDLKATQALLGNLTDILGLDTNLKMKKSELENNLLLKQMELSIQKAGINRDLQDKLQNQADKLRNDLMNGSIQWGDAWKQLQNYAQNQGMDTTPDDLDKLLGGKYSAADPTGTKGITSGWAKPGAYQDYLLNKSGENLNRQLAMRPAQLFMDSINDATLNKLGPQNKVNQFLIQNAGGYGVSQDIVAANQTFELLKQNVVRALQGSRMSDQDIALAQSYIPTIIDTPDTARTKLSYLRKFIDGLSSGASAPSSGGSSKYTILEVK